MEQEQPPPEDDVPGSCTNCEAYLQGKCNQAEHQLLFHVCKLRTGTCKEKEEAARQLGELAKESVRSGLDGGHDVHCLSAASLSLNVVGGAID